MVHRSVRLTAGRFPGANEIMVGQRVAASLGLSEQEMVIGNSITFEGQTLLLSGNSSHLVRFWNRKFGCPLVI